MNRIAKFQISEWYYVLVALGYVATLVFAGMRPGVFAAALMVLVFAQMIFTKKVRFDCLADGIATAFFAYQILSVIWLLSGGYPFSVFTNEFVSSTLPMIFYFVGKSVCDRRANWYRTYLYAMMILGVIGVVLYITAPQFYCDWAYKWSYISKADAATMRVRMHSVVGSTCLSFIMVAGMLAGSHFLGSSDDGTTGSKESEGRSKKIIFSVVTMAACLLFAIMANQRSGLVAAALVIVYVNYLLFFKLDLIPRKYFVYEIVVIAAVFAGICIIKFEFILKFWYRIISLPTAISQRSEQWVAAVNNMYSSWIGNGLGANGHRALGLEDAHVIADGGLVKLYCENGVVGFSLFVYLLVLSLQKGFRNIRRYYVPVGIIIVGLLQSIGSNMLAFQICAPIFWFAVGSCQERR
ncbi:MAG: hypothetical protein K6G67_07610 [Lachnospiraceae bacterium]|nr:hypothetical protein [Lachnospiraceae bacterium]